MGRKIEIVCTKNNVDYPTVRKAMTTGSRTLDDLKEAVGVCGECDTCKENLDYILTTCCGCKEVSMETIQNLVKSGVCDLDEIMEKTGAGTEDDCGRCQKLIENIIELGY